MKTGSLSAKPTARSSSVDSILSGTRLNKDMRSGLAGSSIPIIGALSYNMSVAMYQQHVGMRMSSELDCLHYCSPGLPQVRVTSKDNSRRAQQPYACADPKV
jgi:hypothetical protein